jgi:uncharacterized protein (DUF1330 family)
MPKGYIVANIRAHDMEGMKRFGEASGPVIAEFGGRVLARDPNPELREGDLQGISVVVEFDDVATAQRFYESQGYTDAKAIRQAAADTDLRIVEGV